jgi:hypothetical protein
LLDVVAFGFAGRHRKFDRSAAQAAWKQRCSVSGLLNAAAMLQSFPARLGFGQLQGAGTSAAPADAACRLQRSAFFPAQELR